MSTTTIISYFQKDDKTNSIMEYKSLGGEHGKVLVQIDNTKRYFICSVWKDGSYTRPSTAQKGITVTSSNTDYLAIGAITYKSKKIAVNKIKLLLTDY